MQIPVLIPPPLVWVVVALVSGSGGIDVYVADLFGSKKLIVFIDRVYTTVRR